MKDKEIKYLKSLLVVLEDDTYNFKISLGNGKEIMGIIDTNNNNSEFFDFKTLVKTYLNLHKKINYSLVKSIDLAYSPEVYNDYSPLGLSSGKELMANYYIENAIFRTSTSWDILAQLYNIYYKIGLDKGKIYYANFFNTKFNDNKEDVKNTVEKINKYITEDDDTDCEGQWKGNHRYIKDYRNKMTHRNAPDEVAFSNFDMNFKSPPVFILRRVLEDYYQATVFLDEIIKKIEYKCEEEIKKSIV